MTTTSPRAKIAIYWAASCGGCEVSFLNLDHALLELDRSCELVFCPCLMDAKRCDLEAMADASIDITLLNGGIRTTENLAMARLLRQKSRLLIAFGACAEGGGVPALANPEGKERLLERVYARRGNEVSSGNINVTPAITDSDQLALPQLLERIMSVAEVVRIDGTIPGCPPEPAPLLAALNTLLGAHSPADELLGCTPQRAVCEECPRERRQQRAQRLVRTCAAIPEDNWCLLEQGFPCLGMATRGGCGGGCPAVNMPCTGCYGPLDPDALPVAAALTALAAAIAPLASQPAPDAEVRNAYRNALAAIADPWGTLCRYGAAMRPPAVSGESQ